MAPVTLLRMAAVVTLALGGCAPWSASEVRAPGGEVTTHWTDSSGTPRSMTPQGAVTPASAPTNRAPTPPDRVILFEGDIPDRPYEALGDISVTVNKITIFHPDPTKDMVARQLREEAAKLGADAVIHVRYGTIGIGVASWGSLDGKGRAIFYK